MNVARGKFWEFDIGVFLTFVIRHSLFVISKSSHPQRQNNSDAGENKIRQPRREPAGEMAVHAEGEADPLQNEIREADENAAGHAEEKIPPARLRAERNRHQHHDEARPRRGNAPIKFGQQRARFFRRDARIVSRVFPRRSSREALDLAAR